MADTVQYRLERMVDELDDLERRGIFSRREIAEIVKQRRKFEYRLKRPSPLKEDYLAYIDYEIHLDSLRRLRKRSVTHNARRKKNSVSDYAGVTRIVEIYRLATTRFKGDIGLWLRYLEFCRERRNGRMKKVLAQLIRLHPTVPGVWIYAAAWQFDHNLNVSAARALMHNGLRMCPNSEELWIEYLRMELTYLNKLKARKLVLEGDAGQAAEEENNAAANQGKEGGEEEFLSIESDKRVDLFREQGVSVLRTVYGGAIEALPASLELRKQLLEILEGTDLAHSEELREEILRDMRRDFSNDPHYWDWLARHEMAGSDLRSSQLQKAVQVYEESLQVLPSPEMFSLYAEFLMDVITPKSGENEQSEMHDRSGGYISQLLKVYEKAEEMGCLTSDLACEYVSFYLQLGRLDEAKKLAQKLCSGELSSATNLWVLRASLEIRCLTKNVPGPSNADLFSMFELLKSVLTRSAVSEAEGLWLMALKFFAGEKQYFDKLVDMSFISVAKDGGSDKGFSLPSAVVNFVLHKDGLQRARELYNRFLTLPRPGLAFFKHCIELESNFASVAHKDCLINARKLYESALGTYEQDVSLWQDYHAMEIKLGTSETANDVYSRARKTLKNSAAFVPSTNFS